MVVSFPQRRREIFRLVRRAVANAELDVGMGGAATIRRGVQTLLLLLMLGAFEVLVLTVFQTDEVFQRVSGAVSVFLAEHAYHADDDQDGEQDGCQGECQDDDHVLAGKNAIRRVHAASVHVREVLVDDDSDRCVVGPLSAISDDEPEDKRLADDLADVVVDDDVARLGDNAEEGIRFAAGREVVREVGVCARVLIGGAQPADRMSSGRLTRDEYRLISGCRKCKNGVVVVLVAHVDRRRNRRRVRRGTAVVTGEHQEAMTCLPLAIQRDPSCHPARVLVQTEELQYVRVLVVHLGDGIREGVLDRVAIERLHLADLGARRSVLVDDEHVVVLGEGRL